MKTITKTVAYELEYVKCEYCDHELINDEISSREMLQHEVEKHTFLRSFESELGRIYEFDSEEKYNLYIKIMSALSHDKYGSQWNDGDRLYRETVDSWYTAFDDMEQCVVLQPLSLIISSNNVRMQALQDENMMVDKLLCGTYQEPQAF